METLPKIMIEKHYIRSLNTKNNVMKIDIGAQHRPENIYIFACI